MRGGGSDHLTICGARRARVDFVAEFIDWIHHGQLGGVRQVHKGWRGDVRACFEEEWRWRWSDVGGTEASEDGILYEELRVSTLVHLTFGAADELGQLLIARQKVVLIP